VFELYILSFNIWKFGWMDEWKFGSMDEWKFGWMKEWLDGEMDRRWCRGK